MVHARISDVGAPSERTLRHAVAMVTLVIKYALRLYC
jgi:hypothetical protein